MGFVGDTTPTSKKRKRDGRATGNGTQPNAEAGPSTTRTQRLAPSSKEPTGPARASKRVSRPTMPMAASITTPKTNRTYRSDSDSDESSLPPGILLPKHRIPSKKVSKIKSAPTAKSKPQSTPKAVKHLGIVEITSDSEQEVQVPPRKKPRLPVKASSPLEIIDLCSEEENTPSPKLRPKKPISPQQGEVVVIESDDENPPPSSQSIVESIPDDSKSISSDDTVERKDLERASKPASEEPNNASEKSLDALQHSYSQLMSTSPIYSPTRSQRTDSAFSSPSNSIRPRAIMFTDTANPNPNLHTTVYFRRTLDSIKKKAKAKKPKSSVSVTIKPIVPDVPSSNSITRNLNKSVGSNIEPSAISIIQDAIFDMPLTPVRTPEVGRPPCDSRSQVQPKLPNLILNDTMDADVPDDDEGTQHQIPNTTSSQSMQLVESGFDEASLLDVSMSTQEANLRSEDATQFLDAITDSMMIVDTDVNTSTSRIAEVEESTLPCPSVISSEDSDTTNELFVNTYNDASEAQADNLVVSVTSTGDTAITKASAATPPPPPPPPPTQAITTCVPPKFDIPTLLKNLNDQDDDDDINLSDFELLYPE